MTLAPDPAVPRRNALLRPSTMAGVLSQRLHDGVPVERCERAYVKYRVGESLRVVYRYTVGGATQHAAARSGRSGGIAAPEVGATLFLYPHDRKLTALPDLKTTVQDLLGEPVTVELVAWAAEQSASAEVRDTRGQTIAYAKVEREDGERRGLDALAGARVRVPRVLADAHGVLVLEALAGRRLDRLESGDLERGLFGLGATLALLHAFDAGDGCARGAVPDGGHAAGGSRAGSTRGAAVPRFTRLDPDKLTTAAAVITRARPDATAGAERLLTRLLEDVPEREPVTLHGDANLRNALQLAGGRVAVLDLEHVASGPAAADLGQVLAGLLGARRGAAAALLSGYATLATPPDRAALRWYTAASILARVALPAVSRFRPQQLARLPELLDAGAGLLKRVEVPA